MGPRNPEIVRVTTSRPDIYVVDRETQTLTEDTRRTEKKKKKSGLLTDHVHQREDLA